MKKLDTLTRTTLLILTCGFLAGCATSQHAQHSGPRFRDADTVDAVLHFSSWDYTFLVEPRYHEDGFLRQVPQITMNQVFDDMQVERGTAVVVIGWFYDGETLDRAVTQWKSALGGCGFQRVVILRPNPSQRLNGSVIIDDSSTALSSVRPAPRS